MKQKKTRPHAGERVSALEFKFANYRTLMWKRISTFFFGEIKWNLTDSSIIFLPNFGVSL